MTDSPPTTTDLPPLLEIVANVSEGRDARVTDAIANAVRATPQTWLLHVTSDADHHRSVFTFVSAPDTAVDAAFALVGAAVQHIDLRVHTGVHPRIGAADVVPFVPLGGLTMEDAIAASRALGARVAEAFAMPVFLYERAATHPDRARLWSLRTGGVEGLRERIGTVPAATPDFGPARVHDTAGALVTGARDLMAAFNIHFGDAANVTAVRAIAHAMRERTSGGLSGVRALGLVAHGEAQLSLNLYDLARTGLERAFDRAVDEGRAHGLVPTWSELIGLAPAAVLNARIAQHVRLRDWEERRVLERAITDALAGDAI